MSFITNYLLPYGAIHTVSTSYVELLAHTLHCRRHSLCVHTYHLGKPSPPIPAGPETQRFPSAFLMK